MATDFGFKATTDESDYYFISYNTEDADRVKDICRILNEQGLKIWYDEGIPHDSFWKIVISKKVSKCKEAIFFITKGIFEKAKKLELETEESESEDEFPYTYKEYKFAKKFKRKKLIVCMDKINEIEDWPHSLTDWWAEVEEIQGVESVNESPEQTAKKILKELRFEYVEAKQANENIKRLNSVFFEEVKNIDDKYQGYGKETQATNTKMSSDTLKWISEHNKKQISNYKNYKIVNSFDEYKYLLEKEIANNGNRELTDSQVFGFIRKYRLDIDWNITLYDVKSDMKEIVQYVLATNNINTKKEERIAAKTEHGKEFVKSEIESYIEKAKCGDSDAIAALKKIYIESVKMIAERYELGIGTSQDLKKAFEYYSKAKQNNGDDSDKAMTRIANSLLYQTVSDAESPEVVCSFLQSERGQAYIYAMDIAGENKIIEIIKGRIAAEEKIDLRSGRTKKAVADYNSVMWKKCIRLIED